MKHLTLMLSPFIFLLFSFSMAPSPTGGELDEFMKNWRQSSDRSLSASSPEVKRIAASLSKADQRDLITKEAYKYTFKNRNKGSEEELDIVILALKSEANKQRFVVQTSKGGTYKTSFWFIQNMKLSSDRPEQHIRVLNEKKQVLGGGVYTLNGTGANRASRIYVGNLPFFKSEKIEAQAQVEYLGALKNVQPDDLSSCVAQIFPTLPRFIQRMCSASHDSCVNDNNFFGCMGVIGCSFGYLAVCLHQ